MRKQSNVEREAYTGVVLKEDQVLVPMLADENFLRTNEVTGDKVRCWSTAGVGYKVVFAPVKDTEEAVGFAMEHFQATVNELLDSTLGPNRFSRCLIPQMDGSFKVCPKKRGNNRCKCEDCPNRGKYEREDRGTTSLDAIFEQFAAEIPAQDDIETEVLLPIMLEDFMRRMEKNRPRTYDTLSLLRGDRKRKDVIAEIQEKYDLGSSRAYDILNDAIARLMKEFDL